MMPALPVQRSLRMIGAPNTDPDGAGTALDVTGFADILITE